MKFTSFLAAAFAAHTVNAELVYLVNSKKGNEISSGMAYYADGHSVANGARPDDYTDVVHGSNIIWEGRTVSGTFPSGVTFTSKIFADAASKGINAWSGSGNNGFKEWTCWKGLGRDPIYTVDGWNVYCIYFCGPNKN